MSPISTSGKVVLKQQTHPAIVTDGLTLNFDAFDPAGYDGTNTITDLTGNKHNGTLTNGASHTDGPFVGAGYVEFDGTGDYLNFTNINSGTGDFTYEAWVYPTESGKDNPAVIYNNFRLHTLGLYNTSGGTNAIFAAATRPGFGNQVLYAPDITLNTWHHIAWVKSGSSLKIYVDGVNQTLTDTGTFSGSQLNDVSYVGTTVANEYYEGKISNARVISGTAHYTSNFTPPTKPLTAVTNTALLTCQGNTIADASSSNHTITVNGDAAANLGYPASAFQFDGVNDYLAVPNNDDFNIGTENTMEVWVKLNSAGNSKIFFGKTSTWLFTRSYVNIGVGLDKFGISFHNGSGWSSLSSTTVASTGSWFHLVATWDGTNIRLYVNGTLEATSSDLSSKTWNTTSNSLDVGGYSSYPSFGTNCNIPVARIYHDKALTSTEVTQNYNALKWRFGL